MSDLDFDSLSNSETTADQTLDQTENPISLTTASASPDQSPTLDVSAEITEEVGGGGGETVTTPTPTLPSLTNSFGSFLFPDRGNPVLEEDPKIPSVEDPFKDPSLLNPGPVQDPLSVSQDPTLSVSQDPTLSVSQDPLSISQDPTLSVSKGLGEEGNKANGDEVVFNDNIRTIDMEISNMTTENMDMDKLELEIKNIGEAIESNDLPTEVIEDITENTRESRLLESPTRKSTSKSDGEIHFEKIYRGSSETFTYSMFLYLIVLSVNMILLI